MNSKANINYRLEGQNNFGNCNFDFKSFGSIAKISISKILDLSDNIQQIVDAITTSASLISFRKCFMWYTSLIAGHAITSIDTRPTPCC